MTQDTPSPETTSGADPVRSTRRERRFLALLAFDTTLVTTIGAVAVGASAIDLLAAGALPPWLGTLIPAVLGLSAGAILGFRAFRRSAATADETEPGKGEQP